MGAHRISRDLVFWFDLGIVTVSIAAVISPDVISDVNTLRLVRAIRVLRVFNKLQTLKVILQSLISSAVRVTWATLVMVLVTSIYAVLGVNLFGEKSEYFRNYSSSMFTLFQVRVWRPQDPGSFGLGFGIRVFQE
jgi:hypothetical protein